MTIEWKAPEADLRLKPKRMCHSIIKFNSLHFIFFHPPETHCYLCFIFFQTQYQNSKSVCANKTELFIMDIVLVKYENSVILYQCLNEEIYVYFKPVESLFVTWFNLPFLLVKSQRYSQFSSKQKTTVYNTSAGIYFNLDDKWSSCFIQCVKEMRVVCFLSKHFLLSHLRLNFRFGAFPAIILEVILLHYSIKSYLHSSYNGRRE